jgi:hypothetical protein
MGMKRPTFQTVLMVSTLPIGLVACGSGPISGDGTTTNSPPVTPAGTTYVVTLAPMRKLDLVFMIDNSPASMAPKVDKMNAQFPNMLSALKDPTDGTYPDLRVAIIDSDLGTGGAYAAGSCGPNLDNGNSPFGDLGNFQMRGAKDCGVNDGALWLEYTKGQNINFDKGKDISQVFACLATNLGCAGCGEQHSLQAFEFALVFKSDTFTNSGLTGRNALQDVFLRPEAYLGLVFISDEDDCSAALNDGMFGDKPELRGESASLRCATRAHKCNGMNLTSGQPGYPATASFTARFADCAARTDSCPNSTDENGSTDTSGPTACSPLKDIHHLANEIKALKARPDEQILVAGIFGWPRSDADMATATYKIDLVPNPNGADTMHPQIYDYWPVCYDPKHMPQSSGFDPSAWGWGAQGGLRMAAFIDEFGDNGLKYSICEPNFAAAMAGIGNGFAKKLVPECVPTDFAQGKTCTANYYLLHMNSDGTLRYTISGPALPECADDTTAPSTACYVLATDMSKCPGANYLPQVRRTAAEVAAGPLTEGTKLIIQCR